MSLPLFITRYSRLLARPRARTIYTAPSLEPLLSSKLRKHESRAMLCGWGMPWLARARYSRIWTGGGPGPFGKVGQMEDVGPTRSRAALSHRRVLRQLVALLLLLAPGAPAVRAQDRVLPEMPEGITLKDCVTVCDIKYHFVGSKCVKVRMSNHRVAPLPMVMNVVLQATPTALDRFEGHLHTDHSHMTAITEKSEGHEHMDHIGPEHLAKARAALCQCQDVNDVVEVFLRENTKLPTPIYKNSDIISSAECSGKCNADRVAGWKEKYKDK